jgi:16S rRNA (guanine(1405)-N(7))-methyltransferase
MDDLLADLVTAVTQSPKYHDVVPELIQRIGAEELAKRGSLKEAIKSTKNKLHQIGGAYFEAKLDYAKALVQLQAAAQLQIAGEDTAVFRQSCRDLMRRHASTRERLPILDDFYRTIFASLPPIRSVLDVACGLNPLAIPWMPLAADAEYHAYDIYGEMMGFLQGFFELVGVDGRTHHQDILSKPPTETADLALILKTLPCLEQIDKGAAATLLNNMNARYLLISYPAQSLGGKSKGMVANYEAQFGELVDGLSEAASGRSWHINRFEFATELVFLVATD